MRREEKIGNINNTNRKKTRVFSLFVVFILLLVSFTVMIIIVPDRAEAAIVDGGSWVSPSGYEDPDSDWNDEDETWDGNTATSAQTTVTWLTWAWTNEIELTHGSMRCTKIRFYAWYDSSYCKEINLDRSNGGSVWSGVYQGSFSDRSWVTKTFLEATMTHARIFFYAKRTILSGNIYPDVFELEFFWMAPIGSTQDPQNIEGTSATFRGYISDTNGKNCEYQFRYGLTSGFYGINPTWENEVGTGYFSKASPTLSKGRMYYYRAYIRNGYTSSERSDRVVTCSAEKTFLTKPDPLTGFTATPFGIGQINLTWANSASGDGAYIEYRATDPGVEGVWNPGTQTKIDADGYVAGTSFIHDGLERNTSYWYKAWPYAEDDSEKSDGSSTKPYGTATSVVTDSTEDFPDEWYLVDGDNLHSCCEGESPDLEAALDGTGIWSHQVTETHWFIIDLGTNYTVGKVKGRSITADDPTVVNIYVSRNSTFAEGTAGEDRVASDISTWQDTSSWVVVDSTDRDGRYIKVEITDTEDANDYIVWGKQLELDFKIFDAYVSNLLPVPICSVNNSTPDSGAPVEFDASSSFDQGGSIVNYIWDFNGDGIIDDTTAEAVVNHEYNFSSVYTAIITAEDDLGSTNSTTQQVTVKQKISVVNNSKNDGVNYITWGANDSLMASTLATALNLQSGDTIRKFDTISGNWSDIEYVAVVDIGDFLISRWDYVQITVADDRSHSFTPDGVVDSSHQETMIFNSTNEGYSYITWTNDFTITAEDFAASLGGSGVTGQDVAINIYNPTTGETKNYNPSVPPIFQDNFNIQPYDVISFKAPTSHGNINYDTDDYL